MGCPEHGPSLFTQQTVAEEPFTLQLPVLEVLGIKPQASGRRDVSITGSAVCMAG